MRIAIEGARALLPLVEPQLGPNAAPLREALSQLQIAYAQMVGEAERARRGTGRRAVAARSCGARTTEAEGPGPAQQSGRLWVPGQ